MRVSRAKLAEMLEERLLRNKKLVVLFNPNEMRNDGSWWYVPVWPKNDKIKDRFRYYDVLANVETDLHDNAKINVTLIPVSPPDRRGDA